MDRRVIWMAFAAALAAAATPLAAGEDAASACTEDLEGFGPSGPGVRARDALARTLMEEGRRHSATLARIAAALEHSDLVVYVDADPGSAAGPSGRLQFLSAGGGLRYVHVRLDPGTTSWPAIAQRRHQLTAILAHELYHATEVAAAPAATDAASFAALYLAIGVKLHGTSYDTAAARRVGAQVLEELKTAAPVPACTGSAEAR